MKKLFYIVLVAIILMIGGHFVKESYKGTQIKPQSNDVSVSEVNASENATASIDENLKNTEKEVSQDSVVQPKSLESQKDNSLSENISDSLSSEKNSSAEVL